ncbi:hypothetical protein Tsubulata_013574 [Turnera subulata]|uniref:Ubiquitin carboxyl-terminal hydrolase n=1 Tax=Turnera subulata TaxID=218843 RepID=A0A9Q0IZ10_9ROSI|nr:hypothetical protein Tsubulata_013574 [Turnera subulata]
MNSLIRSLKHGCKSNKWVSSASGLASLVGVAALLLGLLKDRRFLSALPCFPPQGTTSPSRKLRFVPGLQNLGNNCFLNVILQSSQALSSCEYFQPFLQKVIEDCESSAAGEWNENLRLTLALASLLQDLCSSDEGRVVLSPREVMLAMSHHKESFNLTRQQDAEEALLHLLSSLREELSDCYPFNLISLVDALASNSRILLPKERGMQTEQGRWQQHFLGPFDGILSSSLTCQTCSSQISLNFQFFHSLPLSPFLGHGASIMAGCTLEDCLKQFIVSEKVDNYNCSNCWHSAAILCIHLQRVSINHFGELVKLQGHIKFPLILDLLPFMLEDLHDQKSPPNYFEVQSDPRMLNLYGKSRYSKLLATDNLVCSKDVEVGTVVEESRMPQIEDTMGSENNGECTAAPCALVPSQPPQYRLVSVVEHFGRAGGGHYTVYRSVRSALQEQQCDANFKQSPTRWFCISDSDVASVSEQDVLAAEASLLFYERIVEG